MKNITILFTVLAFVFAVQIASASRQSHIIVVVAASTSINDVVHSYLPNITDYLNESSVGLLSIRTGRPPRDASPLFLPIAEPGCVTAGAGSPALADETTRLAEGARSRVSALDFMARTGVRINSNNILAMGAPGMAALNNSGSYQAHPGLLGDTLHNYGLKTAIVGNSDELRLQHRESVYFAADGNGVIDSGDVSSTSLTEQSVRHAYGIKANIAYLCNRTQQEMQHASLIIVDCGDTLRADMYATLCMEEQLPRIRYAALQSLDGLVGSLTKIIGPDDYLIIISPNAALNPSTGGQQLGWVAIKGPGYERDLLTSPSTRRPGVVVLTDFAPTVLASLDIPVPKEMTGRAATKVKRSDSGSLATLQELDKHAVVESQRLVVMRGTSVVFAIITALVTLIIVMGSKKSLRRCAVWSAAVTTTVPVALIVAPIIWDTGALGTTLVVFLLVCIQTLLGVMFLRTPRKLVAGACILTLLLIGLDLVFGLGWMRSSPAGYAIAESARFYGIGNELMGVALGCAFVLLAIGWRKFQISLLKQMLISTLLLVLLFIFIGGSNLGANIGGALSTMPAAVAFVLALRSRRPTIKGVLLSIVITVAAVSCIFVVDYFRVTSQQTHAARMLSLLHAGGMGEALQVILRKIQLNLMLVVNSLWSRLLGITILSVIALSIQLRKNTGKIFASKSEHACYVSLIVATVCAFVFNDSGVVAAATCGVYLWLILILRSFELQSE